VVAGANDRVALVRTSVVAETPAGTAWRASRVDAVRRTGVELPTKGIADRGGASIQADTTDVTRVPAAGRVAQGVE